MDHRWDQALADERAARAEQERYGRARPLEDRDVERRDREALARRAAYKSPWDVGSAHWDQRDLYTRNARVDDAGYGRGPKTHPETGSYAYPREPGNKERESRASDHEDLAFEHERVAFPWANYPVHEARAHAYRERDREEHGLWHDLKEKVTEALGRGSHAGRAPKSWKRHDELIREDACERLTLDDHLDASDIDVLVLDGVITLDGTVPDRESGWLAEELVSDVHGVRDVHNKLRVRADDGPDEVDFAMQLRPA
jgi:hypothetical protein